MSGFINLRMLITEGFIYRLSLDAWSVVVVFLGGWRMGSIVGLIMFILAVERSAVILGFMA